MDNQKVETIELGTSSTRPEGSVTPEKLSVSRSTENMLSPAHQAKNGTIRISPPRYGNLSIETWQRLEMCVLCVVIVIVWGLLCLPFIFYHVPADDDGSTYSPSCSIYEGTICQPFLYNCPLTELINNSVYVSPNKPQMDAEMDVQLRLLLLGPSPECVAGALPFFCQYILRPCDSNGTVYLPSSAVCNVLRSQTCAAEWEATNAVLAVLNQELLPECEALPNSSVSCDVGPTVPSNGSDSSGDSTTVLSSGSGGDDTTVPSSGSSGDDTTVPSSGSSGDSTMVPSNGTLEGSGNGSMQPSSDTNSTISSQCSLECNDGFYCSVIAVGKLDLCRPRCDTFEEYPHSTTVALDVVAILSAIASLISGTAVLISSIIRRKHMLSFPSVFVVYMTFSLMVLSIFFLVGFTDRDELYCSSLDLEESLDEPTPFCTIAGVVFSYTLLQLALWWFFHVATLFWRIQFPFHAKSFETEDRMKYLHIVTIIVGIVLPSVTVITAFGTGGYAMSRFPPILCVPENTDATFYSLLLPPLILVAIGSTLLIILFWKIHKQHGLLKAKMMKSKLPIKIGTAERKLLIVFCYYIIFVVVNVTVYTLNARTRDQLIDGLEEYFVCESTAPDEPCDISSFQEYTYSEVTGLAYALLGLFPSVLLIFAVNIRDIRQLCGCASQHFSVAGSASKHTLQRTEHSVA